MAVMRLPPVFVVRRDDEFVSTEAQPPVIIMVVIDLRRPGP
jgi:hypothetical protein